MSVQDASVLGFFAMLASAVLLFAMFVTALAGLARKRSVEWALSALELASGRKAKNDEKPKNDDYISFEELLAMPKRKRKNSDDLYEADDLVADLIRRYFRVLMEQAEPVQIVLDDFVEEHKHDDR